ncbi:MAG: hypothetical protein U9R72_14490 [Chloroflexota bacterium]|nr:hypothetical protein [Chloroflexota bacterium]
MGRSLLTGSDLVVLGAVLGFAAYDVGEGLEGMPAVALLVGVSVAVIGGASGWRQSQK